MGVFRIQEDVAPYLKQFVLLLIIGLVLDYVYYHTFSLSYLFIGGVHDWFDVLARTLNYGIESWYDILYLIINGIFYIFFYYSFILIIYNIVINLDEKDTWITIGWFVLMIFLLIFIGNIINSVGNSINSNLNLPLLDLNKFFCPQINVSINDFHEGQTYNGWVIKGRCSCRKGAVEGENTNYYYCGGYDYIMGIWYVDTYIEKTMISDNGEIGNTYKHIIVNIYDENGNFIETKGLGDPDEFNRKQAEAFYKMLKST